MTSKAALSEKVKNSASDRRILCCHVNATNRLQIIRITNSGDMYLERVVFPRERLLFEAVPEAKLEIQINEVASILIPCSQLRVMEY
ncbi:MAG: DUF1830 domain-containing protein [Coleofasciculus sp. Co-bin14]|nr:DUF1830 domain-containing protein [Coleofasciculus sp. Co-bin14]